MTEHVIARNGAPVNREHDAPQSDDRAGNDDRRSDNALCAPPSSIGSAQNGVPVANAIDGKTLLGVAALSVLLLNPSGLGVFGFDSAAFSYVAQVLQQVGVLYRDIWDNKQPGIHWFYQSVAQLIGND